MVERADDDLWSSARAHCGLAGPGILSPQRPFPDCVPNWETWLTQTDEPAEARLRDSSHASLPLGSAEFSAKLAESWVEISPLDLEAAHVSNRLETVLNVPRPAKRPEVNNGDCPHFSLNVPRPSKRPG